MTASFRLVLVLLFHTLYHLHAISVWKIEAGAGVRKQRKADSTYISTEASDEGSDDSDFSINSSTANSSTNSSTVARRRRCTTTTTTKCTTTTTTKCTTTTTTTKCKAKAAVAGTEISGSSMSMAHIRTALVEKAMKAKATKEKAAKAKAAKLKKAAELKKKKGAKCAAEKKAKKQKAEKAKKKTCLAAKLKKAAEAKKKKNAKCAAEKKAKKTKAEKSAKRKALLAKELTICECKEKKSDVVVVLDHAGTKKLWNWDKKIVTGLFKMVDASTAMSLITLNKPAGECLVGLTHNKTKLKTALSQSKSSSGMTELAVALRSAQGELELNGRKKTPNVIVVVSHGIPTSKKGQDAATVAADAVKALGYRLIFVPVGCSGGSSHFNGWASKTTDVIQIYKYNNSYINKIEHAICGAPAKFLNFIVVVALLVVALR